MWCLKSHYLLCFHASASYVGIGFIKYDSFPYTSLKCCGIILESKLIYFIKAMMLEQDHAVVLFAAV
jgi:hypothetical protein